MITIYLSSIHPPPPPKLFFPSFSIRKKSQQSSFNISRKLKMSCMCWCIPIIPTPGRLKQEYQESKASLSYITRDSTGGRGKKDKEEDNGFIF
jgi:hypothetical protein